MEFELDFKNETSMIALNIEVFFDCNNTAKLLKLEGGESKLESSLHANLNKQEEKIEETLNPIESEMNLGLLSRISNKGETQSRGEKHIPLMIMHHKGAQYNVNSQVCRIVADSDNVFASNYPNAYFILRHQFNKRFTPEKFIVGSEFNSQCGAYPLGRGIIFTSDFISAFNQTAIFN